MARVGGEEFVWLLPDTTAVKVRHVAETCMQRMRQQQIAHERSEVSPLLTMSLGIGTATPGEEAAAMACVENIDALLYQAKRNGRARAEYARFAGAARGSRTSRPGPVHPDGRGGCVARRRMRRWACRMRPGPFVVVAVTDQTRARTWPST